MGKCPHKQQLEGERKDWAEIKLISHVVPKEVNAIGNFETKMLLQSFLN